MLHCSSPCLAWLAGSSLRGPSGPLDELGGCLALGFLFSSSLARRCETSVRPDDRLERSVPITAGAAEHEEVVVEEHGVVATEDPEVMPFGAFNLRLRLFMYPARGLDVIVRLCLG